MALGATFLSLFRMVTGFAAKGFPVLGVSPVFASHFVVLMA